MATDNKKFFKGEGFDALMARIKEAFDNDELTEVKYLPESGLEPGHCYKVASTDVMGYNYAVVQAISDTEIGKYGIVGGLPCVVKVVPDQSGNGGVIHTTYCWDEEGNEYNFHPAHMLKPSGIFRNNKIMLYKVGSDQGDKGFPDFSDVSTMVNCVIEDVVTITAAAVQNLKVARGASVDINAGTNNIIDVTIGANANVRLTATAAITNCVFEGLCDVTGTNLTLFQMNKVGYGSNVMFEGMCAGNEIGANCDNISLANSIASKIGTACHDIQVLGAASAPCSYNEFGMMVGTQSAKTGYNVILKEGASLNKICQGAFDVTIGKHALANVIGESARIVIPDSTAANPIQFFNIAAGTGAAATVAPTISMSAKTIGGNPVRVGAGYRTNVGQNHTQANSLVYWLDSELGTAKEDTFTGTNVVSTVVNMPVSKNTVLAEISADATASFVSGLPVGKEVHAIVKNTGTADITVTLPEGSNVPSIVIEPGTVGEINVMNVNGTYYVRGAGKEVVDAGSQVDLTAITNEEIDAMFEEPATV